MSNEGAKRLGRPTVPTYRKKQAMQVYLEPATIKRIRAVAALRDVPPARLAAQAINTYFDDPANCR